jgi:hypothetical protein
MPQSHITGGNPGYSDHDLSLKLAPAPDANWVNDFNGAAQSLKAQGLNVSVHEGSIHIQSGKPLGPYQSILDSVKKIVDQVNQKDDDRDNQFKNLKF